MPVLLSPPDPAALLPVAGIELGIASAGIKKPGRKDVLVMSIAPDAEVVGIFTQNRFCAAPVSVCREHLMGDGHIRALVVNTGNANAGTGQEGLARARQTCAALARLMGIQPQQVLPFSTGVILEPLPVDRIVAALPAAVADLKPANWAEAAQAIMTTDLVPKAASRRVSLGGTDFVVTGIAKGSGMIHPNMATMLCFVATDAPVSCEALEAILRYAVNRSFNCISVDGDTSTNDACILVATGAAGQAPVIMDDDDARFPALRDAITALMMQLAQAIVRDGEGATKLVKVNVEGAASDASAKAIARTICESPLVKTAIAGEDANWGRIVMAIGRADQPVKREMIAVRFGDLYAARDGMVSADYDEAAMSAYMKRDSLEITVTVGPGNGRATMHTCDLTKRYVEINGDYRS